MQVDDAVRKSVKEGVREDAHESGQHDEIRLCRGDNVGQGRVTGRPIGMVGLPNNRGLDSCTLGAPKSRGVCGRRDHQNDVYCLICRNVKLINDRLEVAT